jgi:hypothetical protein
MKFPAYERFNKKYKGINEFKAEGSNFQDFDPKFSQLRDEIASKEFCQMDYRINRNRLHCICSRCAGFRITPGGNGSFLDVHIDFNIHVEQGIHRRCNLLIFFNKDWKEEYGRGKRNYGMRDD